MSAAGAMFAMNGITQLGTSFAQSKAISAQGIVEEARLNQNAAFAERQANDAISRGKKEVTNLKRNTKGLIGAQRASYAGQNVVVDSGSALDAQEDSAVMSELDALEIKGNAYREAYGYKVDAITQRGAAASARRASRVNSTSTLLTGANQALSYGLQSYDAFSKKPS